MKAFDLGNHLTHQCGVQICFSQFQLSKTLFPDSMDVNSLLLFWLAESFFLKIFESYDLIMCSTRKNQKKNYFSSKLNVPRNSPSHPFRFQNNISFISHYQQ
ncbi:hypothetical protein VIGAN_04367000 [Vigna angularis var. angularis]|uniref:Uncharacterized protein n=1 Tax=Vigna angularis var. angularis TaxID=157739 RepID=A0A0S3RZW2_PHAAN|nr:hypothetical protein VIGAN_04367000 [Vigna angularis var. angularis]